MTHDAAAAKVQAAARNAANDNNPTIGRPNLHHETRSGLLFVGSLRRFSRADCRRQSRWLVVHEAHRARLIRASPRGKPVAPRFKLPTEPSDDSRRA